MSAKTGNSRYLVGGLVAAVVAAAFLGGYALGGETAPASAQYQAAPAAPAAPVAAPPRPDAGQLVFASTDDDPVKGSPDAPLTVIEFSDFQCPFCNRFYQDTLPQLEREYIDTGKVNLVFRDMPLDIHPNALPAHMAAECADGQGAFWEYHDLLFDRAGQWGRLGPADLIEQLGAYADELGVGSGFDECMVMPDTVSEVRKDLAQGSGYGVTGTPTFFIGNDDVGYTKVSGAKPYESFRSIIESKLG
ncbi:protein-disulfide isomerase [Cenarchaeum symbiosum A]|uniref:Protein-disulfide isomerase n=1 Tax=Cenarchaeum symbiosum (strain A) TaxID=414004 RepID=A0RUW6_CENSY|nr:protein-disulfide isomerase [Cenarchaeum symbiosum A]